MRKILIYGGVAVVTLIALFLVVVSMQPSEFTVERSKVIAASQADVWPHISELPAFLAWNPWHDLDPDQTVTFSDPQTGVGSWYTWKGNDQVGSGKMTVTALEEPNKATQDLEFVEPFASQAKVTLASAAVEGGTQVTWTMESQNDFMGKMAGLFMDMETMIGNDFDRGLTELATVAQADAQARQAAEAQAAAEAAAAEEQAATEAADGEEEQDAP